MQTHIQELRNDILKMTEEIIEIKLERKNGINDIYYYYQAKQLNAQMKIMLNKIETEQELIQFGSKVEKDMKEMLIDQKLRTAEELTSIGFKK